MEAIRKAGKMLVGKREGKRPFGSPRPRWGNVKTDMQYIGYD
jgi:hypothetical protein